MAMLLQDIAKNGQLLIQIVWGEKIIEFLSKQIDSDSKGIYVAPYLHNGKPLSLNIDPSGGMPCHLFGEDLDTGKRVSWRNVRLETTTRKGNLVYKISTMAFNKMAKEAERREHERCLVRQMGEVRDMAGDMAQVMINDLSDTGISFFAPFIFVPNSKLFTVEFSDTVDGDLFRVAAQCRTVYSTDRSNNVLYGCEIVSANSDYYLYGCMKRLQKMRKRTMKDTQEEKTGSNIKQKETGRDTQQEELEAIPEKTQQFPATNAIKEKMSTS